MKTKYFVLSLFLLCLVNPLFSEEMLRYNNKEIGVSVDYPASWVIEDSYESISFISEEDFSNQGEGAGFCIVMRGLESFERTNLSDVFDILLSEIGDIDFEEPVSIVLSGFDCLKVSFYDPDQDMSGEINVLICSKLVYMILSLYHPPLQEENYNFVIASMLNSLTITRPKKPKK